MTSTYTVRLELRSLLCLGLSVLVFARPCIFGSEHVILLIGVCVQLLAAMRATSS